MVRRQPIGFMNRPAPMRAASVLVNTKVSGEPLTLEMDEVKRGYLHPVAGSPQRSAAYRRGSMARTASARVSGEGNTSGRTRQVCELVLKRARRTAAARVWSIGADFEDDVDLQHVKKRDESSIAKSRCAASC
jgi:hypothetical protein